MIKNKIELKILLKIDKVEIKLILAKKVDNFH